MAQAPTSKRGRRFDLCLGWRLEGVGAGSFEMRLEGSRLDPANDATEHHFGLTLNTRC